MRREPRHGAGFGVQTELQRNRMIAGIGGQAGMVSQLRGETSTFFPENLGMRVSICAVQSQTTKESY